MSSARDQILAQINDALGEWKALRPKSKHDDLSDLHGFDPIRLMAILGDVIVRFAPPGSVYRNSFDVLMKQYGPTNTGMLTPYRGIVDALKRAYEKNYLSTIEELLHASLFADFLEMALHLHDEGYKDAAAVIAGSTLEEHLRALCSKNGIGTVDGNGKSKKADLLNADLKGASVYSGLDQKNVTAWLDLRNKAAHGRYTDYSKEQVALMIEGIRDFLTRNPA